MCKLVRQREALATPIRLCLREHMNFQRLKTNTTQQRCSDHRGRVLDASLHN